MSVDFWGQRCELIGSKIRNFTLMTSLTLCLTMLPAASRAFTQEDQRRLCTGDVFRLCSSEIPSVERITACYLLSNHALEKVRALLFSPQDAYDNVLVEEVAGVRAQQSARPVPAAAPAGPASILVVEDDADTRVLIERFLQSGGYAVSSAGDGIDLPIILLNVKGYNTIPFLVYLLPETLHING